MHHLAKRPIYLRRERELEDKERKEIETAVKKMSYENKIKELEETVSCLFTLFEVKDFIAASEMFTSWCLQGILVALAPRNP